MRVLWRGDFPKVLVNAPWESDSFSLPDHPAYWPAKRKRDAKAAVALCDDVVTEIEEGLANEESCRVLRGKMIFAAADDPVVYESAEAVAYNASIKSLGRDSMDEFILTPRQRFFDTLALIAAPNFRSVGTRCKIVREVKFIRDNDVSCAALRKPNDCTIVTDNEKDFAGIEIVNPLRATKWPAAKGKHDGSA
jgi:predicted nucleic acid-binding protein